MPVLQRIGDAMTRTWLDASGGWLIAGIWAFAYGVNGHALAFVVVSICGIILWLNWLDHWDGRATLMWKEANGMGGNWWMVKYEGPRKGEALTVLSAAENRIVRCGGAGAIWRATVEHEIDGVVTIELWPVDPHDVDPTVYVSELPMPAARR
jgi:hypothetical protein